MDPAIHVTERLVRLFGDEILEPVKVFRDPGVVEAPSTPHSQREEEIMVRLRSRRYRVTHAARAPLDIAASKEDDEVTIIVRHGRDKALYERSSQVAEMASAIGARAIAVVDDPEIARDLEALGIEVVRRIDLGEDKGARDNW
ncbi:MAG: hypothetical protein QI199_04710 [Candidatus Korarchaeota archaeon]|nr:hypothetical protein [Candidatus Korarchaeota archaeon]